MPRQHGDAQGEQGSEDAGCRLSQTSGGLVNSTAFFIALKTLSTIRFASAMMSPGQMPAIPNVGIGSSTSVVKPTEGMVEYNGRQWGVTCAESVVWLREPY